MCLRVKSDQFFLSAPENDVHSSSLVSEIHGLNVTQQDCIAFMSNSKLSVDWSINVPYLSYDFASSLRFWRRMSVIRITRFSSSGIFLFGTMFRSHCDE